MDKDEERVNEALDLVTHAQIGDSTNPAFIASLGVRNFDMCVVAIGDDFQSSLETTALLKDMGARFVLSRAARDVHAKFLLRNGADDVVYPERQSASWAAVRYSSRAPSGSLSVPRPMVFISASPKKPLGCPCEAASAKSPYADSGSVPMSSTALWQSSAGSVMPSRTT